MRLLGVATCNLNQWAMDFDTNLRNVKESIARAKTAGAVVRIGPELELTGYGCEDHFLEQDTTAHAWECLKDILSGDYTDNILCSIGMPIIFRSVRYNCQVFCLNRKIIMIRPKMSLANDGNYREFRWFSAWTYKDELVEYQLPIDVSEAISQETVPFGYGYIEFLDVSLAAETCEELFTANAPRIDLAFSGVEVFMNASGSHHQLRKLNLRIDSIRNATRLCGGVYMYANQQGCDGARLYYDGCCCIAVNGDVVAQGSQFSLKDVEVLDALIDLDAVSSYRACVSSFREQASHVTKVPCVKVQYKLCQTFCNGMIPTNPIEIMYHCPEEEIAFGPSCWLWDYLRRSQASGFLLPLSGGADSSSVAAIVGCMCQLVIKDGCCCIAVNGDVVAQGSQFSLKDVEVLDALIDLDAVSSYRACVSSFREQASHVTKVPCVKVQYKLCQTFCNGMIPTNPIEIMYHCPEEEIAFGPSCWLWDYLRRSQASGFLLPLSGGADSSSVAAIVGCMCQLVIKDIEKGDQEVKADAMRIGQYKDGKFPTDSRELAKRLFYTVYMGTENSSEDTRSRAKRLAEEIGSFHFDVPIDSVVSAFLSLFERFTGKRPLYKVDGGSHTENLGLQNIQARVRMVLAFMMASLMPWVHNKSGFYLVLGSSNVDEGLRGYLTKYDCSSADINPIGSVSKQDLRAFLRWAAVHLQYSSLAEVEAAPPTAELEPIRTDYNQLDEVDMGMTYEELSIYGRLRKIFRCGPVSMFQNLCHRWCGRLSPSEVADKVKHFHKYYAINRHKMTVLTPSYHAESYSPEDNRFDLRQFLYNTAWPHQFRKIDQLVQDIDKDGKWGDSTDVQLREHRTVRSAQGTGMGVVAAGSANPSAGL